MKKTWLVMTAICSLVLFVFGLIFFRMFTFYPKVYEGIAVAGVDVSGYSREEVVGLLTFLKKQYYNKSIVLYYEDKAFVVNAASIEFEIDVDSTLDEVWNYGRTGLWWERVSNIRLAVKSGYPISLVSKYNEEKLNQLIDQCQDSIERPPHNATISLMTGNIVPEKEGYQLETETLGPLVIKALIATDMDKVALPVTILHPAVTSSDITTNGIHEVISRYTTIFNHEDDNRATNIEVAALKINGYILQPGKDFSFNEVVGPREKKYGFKEALEIVDGEFVSGIGGGICQLSSTLYNAALLANLEIVERTNHSKPLSYVPLGRDATVVFGELDFKFINNTKVPLMIMAEVNGNKLMVGIVGQRSTDETVEIISINKKDIPPSITKRSDDSLYLGETRIDKPGKSGYAITTVRVVRLWGHEVKREILSEDHYSSEDRIIKFGTRLPPFIKNSQS